MIKIFFFFSFFALHNYQVDSYNLLEEIRRTPAHTKHTDSYQLEWNYANGKLKYFFFQALHFFCDVELGVCVCVYARGNGNYLIHL